MGYYNCGVQFNGKWVKTKKELKEHLGNSRTVRFVGTSMFQDIGGYWDSDVPEGLILSVVGPDPYNSRKWYATVENKNGKLVVK